MEPIAVCGLSLKFPQDASSEKNFWSMLLEKRNAMTEYPSGRVNVDAFHHPTRRNALRPRGAHFIKEDLGVFDANFFSLTPTEAAAMDPMQRILLETTFKAFENAGVRLQDVSGSRTSVHTGCFTNDYLVQMLKDPERLPPYAAVGATQSMLANRLSWFFDLRGPSVNLDSACSSSAMAVDLACQLLHSGVTDMGVVAGCNLLLDPDYSTILSNMQMLSPDSLCYAFDHRANGYSRGEGVAVVILKRLSDALRSNDSIRAVIRAHSTNQDGRTPGITQPDPKAQAQLIRETYQRAGLSMRHTRFFEAHGTGTAIGDPVEVGAIADCFHQHRNPTDPLYVGSVKTNIGHLEGASGIAGLIKAVLVVESGVIPPNANFESINRKLASYSHMIRLPPECVPWPPCEVRRASINSFGYGGTNSHIVIDDISSYLRRKGLLTSLGMASLSSRAGKTACPTSMEEFPKLLVWSATTGAATRAMISSWEKFCSEMPDDTPASWVSDLAYTLDSRRSTFLSKSFAVIKDASDLRSLSQIASAPTDTPKQTPRLAFVFTGQGAQWHAMGRELFPHPEFAESIRVSELYLSKLGCSWLLHEEFLKDEKESNIHRPDIAQTLTAVLQMGLVDLLRFFGVSPVAVVGHSMGEIAAAYCAGLLTRESALRVSYYRGLFTATLREKSPIRGAMLVAALSSDQLLPYFGSCGPGSLVISCINSPSSTTVSGDEAAVETLKQILDGEGIFVRRLHVPVAYHSPQMDLIVSDCLRSFEGLESPQSTTNIKMVSSVTGEILTRERACEGSYWTTNLVSPVLFSRAVERLCRDSARSLRKKINGSHRNAVVVDTLIEIGPHAALRLPTEETVQNIPRKQEIKYFSALYRKQSASVTLLRLLGELHCCGVPVKLRCINDPEPSSRDSRVSLVDAPEYPFDHSTRYWSESALVRSYNQRAHGHVPLLGAPSWGSNPLEPQWRCCVQVGDMPWLLDHKLNGKVIYPASAMIVMAIEGVLKANKPHQNLVGFTLRDIRYQQPIAVPTDSTDLETRLQLRPLKATPADRDSWVFSVHSLAAGHWVENCCGMIETHCNSVSWPEENTERSRYYKRYFDARAEQCYDFSDSSAVYNRFSKSGFQYGPSFQGLKAVHHNGSDIVTASLSLDSPLGNSTAEGSFVIHPGTLDSFLHLALVSVGGGDDILPTQAISRIKKLWISAEGLQTSPESVQASARFEGETSRTKLYSGFALTDDKTNVKLVLEGLQTIIIADVEEAQETMGNHQFWCGIETAVDVEVLPGTEVSKRLNSMCGPDPEGPSDFFRTLRRYLYHVVKDLHHDIKATGTDPRYPYLKRYVDWMDWQLDTPVDNTPEASDSSLRLQIAKYGRLGDVIVKVADNALDVLQGKSSMVQLLFEDNLVEVLYEQWSVGSLYNQKLQKYLEDLSFKHPNMDFLEIGAGTGSFTEYFLNAVSSDATGAKERFNSYCFTDISAAFFESARKRFPGYTHKLKFAILDAEQDPLNQGFREKSFDVISASNVLHVTSNLDQTLQRLRMLLKPGGKLFLHEYVKPERIEVGFVFGLLSGWWPDTDSSRLMSPLSSEETWDKLLRRNGFSGAEFILRDFADEESHLMSIICATATDSGAADAAPPEVTIAVEPGSSLQAEMADILTSQLSAEGHRVTRVNLFDPQVSASSPRTVVALFDLESSILSRLNKSIFEALKRLLLSASRTLWVSKVDSASPDPSHGIIDGFARVFRIENINTKLATLALETKCRSPAEDCGLIVSALRNVVRSEGLDQPEDYTVQDGNLTLSRIHENIEFKAIMSDQLAGVRRVTKRAKDAKPFRIMLSGSNDHKSAQIIEDTSASETLGPDEVEIDIQAISLNPADVANMSGKAYKLGLGRECSGIVARVGSGCDFVTGDRVCAYGTDMLRSTGRTKRSLVAKIPESLSFEAASTLPQDHIVANYLVRESRVEYGDVVIVRGGDTRLGRATLGILGKKTPNIGATISAAGDDTALPRGVQRLMEGCFTESFRSFFSSGASIVLDFVNTEIHQLTECVSMFGQILSIREFSDGNYTSLSSFELPPTVGFRIVDVVELLHHQLGRLEMPYSELDVMSTHIQPKVVDLSSIGSIEADMSSHSGLAREERIVIKYNDQSQIEFIKSSDKSDLFDASASYMISGGLGDLGRRIAMWMVSRGARNLILLSRSGPPNEEVRTVIRNLEKSGARVCTPLCDVADRSSLQSALGQLQDMPPIKGCVQAAGAIKDVVYENMSFDDWKVAVNPKMYGSWNLHQLLPKGMDFFILISSISGIIGQPTQTNYAAGNTYQDALARYRLSMGEKAVSLDLGILATGGLLSQSEGLAERLSAEKVFTILSEPEILAILEHFCDADLGIDQIPPQIIAGTTDPSWHRRRGVSLPPAFSQPLWSQTLVQRDSSEEAEGDTGGITSEGRSLADATSIAEMSEIVAGALADQICSLVLTPRASINLEEPLHTAGADSLSAVYLRNWIMKQFSVDMAIFDILGDMPIIALGNAIANEWQAAQAAA